MDEQKFTLGDYADNRQELWFDGYFIIVRQSDAGRLCDLLNAYDEEVDELKIRCGDGEVIIRDLKEENEELKSRISDYDKALKTLQDLTDRKLKENEQLNIQIQRERTASTKQHLKWSKEAEEQIQTLKKENEQLKQRINSRLHYYRELYETTNDEVVKRVIEDLEDILK